MKYMDKDSILLPPRASALLESLRGMSYSLETAVSDVIDNSISAGAQIIDVNVIRNENGLPVALDIVDDGCGMSRAKMLESLTLGSTSPRERRNNQDLGRFGLGLKTASFSQCRRLVVASRVDGGTLSAFAWDLDEIARSDKWQILELDPTPYESIVPKAGTLVRWEKLDRALAFKDKENPREFRHEFDRLRKHLSLFFHRFLKDGDFTLRFMGRDVIPWDPFASLDPAKPCDFLRYGWPPRPEKPQFHLKGYVFPPKGRSELTLFGPEDEINLQGFFVYRNKRLLSAGGWLGLRNLPSAPEFRFARICIDFDNTHDEDWRLDICKTKVSPPRAARPWLSQKASVVRDFSEKVAAEATPHVRVVKTEELFWKKTARGELPMPFVSGTWLTPLMELAEEGKLSGVSLKGFAELLALTHPTALKTKRLTVPSEEVGEVLRLIVERLSQDRHRAEVVSELRSCRPFSEWPALMNELEEG